MNIKNISSLTDPELLTRLSFLIGEERKMTVGVLLHLSEVDRRKLYLKAGFSSLFSYLTETFHYAGGAAYRRIQVARLIQKFPQIIDLLEKGDLNLTTLSLIAPHLREGNKEDLLSKIIHKSKEEVESVISSLFQVERSSQRDRIRLLPVKEIRPSQIEEDGKVSHGMKEAEKKGQTPLEVSDPFFSAPTSSGGCAKNRQEENPMERRVKIEFCASEGVAKKIERAKEILRHKFPKGQLEEIISQALDDLLEKRDPMRGDPERKIRKTEQKQNPSSKTEVATEKSQTRYIPQSVKREVWQRDEGQCTYQSKEGKRCSERGGLEWDHVKPWALGGENSIHNLRLLCAAHNRFRSEKTFGRAWRRSGAMEEVCDSNNRSGQT